MLKWTSLIFLFSVQVLAANYGDAGCGLGSVVVGKDGNQIIAATSNATGIQSFGITSGTSNCVDDGAVKRSAQVPMYIEVNRTALAKDAARGSGETLAGLAHLLGCQKDSFNSAVKSHYDDIFVKSGMKPVGIQISIERMIQSNPSSVCGA